MFNDKAELDSLFTDKIKLDSLYDDKAKLDSLYADKTVLDRIYASISNLDRVYSSIDSVDLVSADIANVIAVDNNKVNIDVVATNADDITLVSADMLKGVGTNTATDSAILNALNNAGVAADKANAASISAGNALASENAAKTSETNSSSSEAAAAISVTRANTSANTASGKAAESASSATASSDSANTAATQASNSATSASNALDSEVNAKTSETNAAVSEGNSHDWSSYTVDAPVPGGNGNEYSAKHWASKAAAAATGSLKYLGVWDATAGYPTSPVMGDYYKVGVAGPETSSPYSYNKGDSIIYNGTGWDLIDSSDAVNSVDGQIGAVNLTSVYEPKNVNIQEHVASTVNPHAVTKAQIGLGNVDNTSDISKPVSTAQAAADQVIDGNALAYAIALG